MFGNTECPYPAILLISNFTKCLYRGIQRVCTTVLQDKDNVQNAVNTLSVKRMHNIRSTANLSRQCIQFTPVKVHNTSSLYPLDISSKTQLAFLTASEYQVHLWPDVQYIYVYGSV